MPEWLVASVGTLLVLFSAFLLRGRGMAAARPRRAAATAGCAAHPAPSPDRRERFLALVALAALLGVWFGKSGPE